MDVQMAVMDGLGATRLIRKSEAEGGRRVPIVALTARAMKQDEQIRAEAGMDAYLSKPIHSGELLRLMQALGSGSVDISAVKDG